MRRAIAGLLAAFTAVLGVAVAQAAPPKAAVTRAGDYLVAQQNPDGSWTDAPTIESVADGVVALVSAGAADTALARALNYLSTNGPAGASRTSMTAKVILAAVAGGRDPRDFGHVDYVGRLRGYYNANTGNYEPTTDPNSLAILALVAAKEPVPERAITSLESRQCSDGGIGRSGCLLGSSVSSTAVALNALIAAGVGSSDPVYAKARAYLVTVQNADGGFGDAAGQITAAVPTAAAASAIVAMAEDPTASPWSKSAGHDPYAALVGLQDVAGGVKADSSAATGDPATTASALPGLAGRALPVRPAPVAAPATSTTAISSGAPGNAVTTTAPAKGRSSVGPRTTRTSAPAVTTPTTRGGSNVKLASPASRDDAGGRSLIGLLPFAATLFGAGALGVVLRRRARI